MAHKSLTLLVILCYKHLNISAVEDFFKIHSRGSLTNISVLKITVSAKQRLSVLHQQHSSSILFTV